MTKQLGPGVRVRSGWTPDEWIAEVKGDPRLLTGTVIQYDGVFIMKNTKQPHHFWWVRFDGWGREVSCAEYILTPIDDDDEQQEEQEQCQKNLVSESA